MGSLLIILFSGLSSAMRIAVFELAWPKVAVGALVLMAPLGAVTGRHMRTIRKACADARTVNAELLTHLRDPFLKVSLGIRSSVFLGILLLMAAKPEWWQSVGVVGGSVVLGLLVPLVVRRRTGPLSIPSADLGDRTVLQVVLGPEFLVPRLERALR